MWAKSLGGQRDHLESAGIEWSLALGRKERQGARRGAQRQGQRYEAGMHPGSDGGGGHSSLSGSLEAYGNKTALGMPKAGYL